MKKDQAAVTAFNAMVEFLDQYYRRGGSDEIGLMLGSLALRPDGGTADPAAWDDWMEAYAKASSGHAEASVPRLPRQGHLA